MLTAINHCFRLVPRQFYANMRNIVGSGTTLLATDGGLISGCTGNGLTAPTSDQ